MAKGAVFDIYFEKLLRYGQNWPIFRPEVGGCGKSGRKAAVVSVLSASAWAYLPAEAGTPNLQTITDVGSVFHSFFTPLPGLTSIPAPLCADNIRFI